MNVGSICKHQVITVNPTTELVSAAELMRQQHVGFIVVVEPRPEASYGRPVGVLTDRDIVISVIAQGADPKLLTVADVMKQFPALVEETDSVEQALHTMRRMGVRRVPVVSANGLLTGILALDDVLDVLSSELGDVSGTVRNEQRIEGRLR